MEKLLKDLRKVCEKHETEVKCGQSPIEVKWVNYRHCYDESAKPSYRKVVMKVDYIEKDMEHGCDISVDIGEGKDRSVATLFEISKDGKYIPLAVSDTISFGSDVERSGYVGVEAGELSFSAEFFDVDHYALRELLGLDFVRDMTNALFSYCVDTCGKRRKTTYKTIRRDCAKRNRHK